MTSNNYSRQSGPSWFGFYFSRFLSSRVLRLNMFGRTYRFAWTWHFEAERVRASVSVSDIVATDDKLRVAMAAVDEQERVA